MPGAALPLWSPLVAVVLLHAGLGWARPVTGSPSGPDLRSLEDLLKRLDERLGPEDPGPTASDEAAAAAADLDDSEAHPLGRPDLEALLPPAEAEALWRAFLASPKRRRDFSGCFGARLERIGTQTGLGCKVYKPRSRRKNRS